MSNFLKSISEKWKEIVLLIKVCKIQGNLMAENICSSKENKEQ